MRSGEGKPASSFCPYLGLGWAVEGAGFLVVLGLMTMLLLVMRGPYQPAQNWVSLPPCWKRMWRTPGG